jgi:hypothetical protein
LVAPDSAGADCAASAESAVIAEAKERSRSIARREKEKRCTMFIMPY